MAICSDRICEAIVECEVCESLKPRICGRKGVTFVQGSCNGLKLIGADDVTLNQGIGIDLTEGVHAYDGNGNEIEYKFIPTEIPKCAVGEHTVRYTVVGLASKMKPSICQKDRLHTPSLCGELDTLVKDRVVIITQAEPPRISGVEMITIQPSTDFDPMSGVSAVDDNGNTLEVEYDGEYTKETSGEIASFDTSLAKYMPKVEVSLEPKQDGTPWVDSDIYSEPYLFKASPTLTNEYNSENISIVGGTIAWNQLLKPFSSTNWRQEAGVTATYNNGEAVFTSTTANNGLATLFQTVSKPSHVVLYAIVAKASEDCGIVLRIGGNTVALYTIANLSTNYATICALAKTPQNTVDGITYILANNSSINKEISVKTAQVFDLTQIFGSTIADYIYGLEQSQAGAGVAWFKKLFPNDYYEYNAGELMSVEGLQSHDMVGFNQWDEEWDVDLVINGIGGNIGSKNLIPVLPSTAYYFYTGAYLPSANGVRLEYFDANGNSIGGAIRYSPPYTMPENCHYIKFGIQQSIYGRTYKNDICINLSWSGWRNGEYEPYQKHSYALDDSLTLRGIPKLDSQNNLYYDGDEYKADGSVTRKYGIVDLGTLNWRYETVATGGPSVFSVRATDFPTLSGGKLVTTLPKQYTNSTSSITNEKILYYGHSYYSLIYYDTSITSVASFKTAMSGVMLVYELTTPTTEVATPYTNPQAVESGGTEEFVTSNVVPVGHRTRYANIVPIEGYTEVTAQRTGKNLFDKDSATLVLDKVRDDSGTEATSVGACYTSSITKVSPSTQYTLNGLPSSPNLAFRIYFLDTNGGWISRTNTIGFGSQPYTFTTPTNCYGLQFQLGKANTDFSATMLELGSTATAYEPYQSDTYTTQLGQTVYGGTLNIVTGELVVDRAMVDLGSLTWQYMTTSGRNYFRSYTNPARQSNSAMLCSKYTYGGVVYDSQMLNASNGVYSPYGSQYLYVKDTAYTDATSFKTAMNGVQLVYELAEPQTYWLTPQQVNSLAGRNNVWSDDGNVEVEYWDTMPQGTVQFLNGVYNITYTAEDECGNKTVEVRTIVVGNGNKVCKARACEAFIECDAQ